MSRHIPLLLFLAACGRAPAPETPWLAHYPAGVPVRFDSVPQWTDATAWRLDITSALVIPGGAALGHPRLIRGIGRFEDGSLVVGLVTEARWLDSTGRLLRILGRKGEGPGEFEYLRQVVPLGSDTVALVEPGRARKAALFGRDGALIREERLDLERFGKLGRWTECDTWMLPDRSWLSCLHDPTIPRTATNRPNREIEPGVTSPGPGLLRQLHRFALASPALDTAYRLGLDIGIEQFGIELSKGDELFVVHPFHARSEVAFGGSPFRIAILTNPEERIEIWTQQGTLERVIGRRGARAVPTKDERRIADSLTRIYGDTTDPTLRPRVMGALVVPDSLPAGAAMAFGPEGELFVMRGRPLPGQAETLIDVFGTEGRWLGTLHAPPRFWLQGASRNHLLGIRYGDDDVPRVESYRIVRP